MESNTGYKYYKFSDENDSLMFNKVWRQDLLNMNPEIWDGRQWKIGWAEFDICYSDYFIELGAYYDAYIEIEEAEANELIKAASNDSIFMKIIDDYALIKAEDNFFASKGYSDNVCPLCGKKLPDENISLNQEDNAQVKCECGYHFIYSTKDDYIYPNRKCDYSGDKSKTVNDIRSENGLDILEEFIPPK